MRGLLMLACAVGLMGCGGDESGGSLSKSEYEQRFREIIREAEQEAPGSDAAAQTPREQAEEIDEGLDRLVQALQAGDEKRAEAMLEGGALVGSPAARKIPSARREFAEKGYDLGDVSDFP